MQQAESLMMLTQNIPKCPGDSNSKKPWMTEVECYKEFASFLVHFFSEPLSF